MTTAVYRLSFALFGLLAVHGCSSDVSGPGNVGACTTNVSVTVSSGTSPTFTWTPACRVIALLVEQDASDQWFLEATGEGIAPGVSYGSPPAGSIQHGPALQLVRGTTYEVILFRGTESNPIIAAIEEFTP